MCGEHRQQALADEQQFGSSPRVRGTPSPRFLLRLVLRFIPACAGNTATTQSGRGRYSVHPRVCGEHHNLGLGFQLEIGSSPRVRGTHTHNTERPRRGRFIPACAGNTRHAVLPSPNTSVHPRVCGEHHNNAIRAGKLLGSSPRVRGTPAAGHTTREPGRFIPACAGNTSGISESHDNTTVHPRVCGEHCWSALRAGGARGSSPRVRGTRRPRSRQPAFRRFIHPRVCGEHQVVRLIEVDRTGSSPRVRGTRRLSDETWFRARFIPACAGNTAASPSELRKSTVHPRVCGEHPLQASPRKSCSGSSPRVRGTREGPLFARRLRRFIPACAGNTIAVTGHRRRRPVHPRVCGEHGMRSRRSCRRCGSSPRVRGTLTAAKTGATGLRFIPACAGNTISRMPNGFSPSVHPRVCGEHPVVRADGDHRFGSSPRVRGTRSLAKRYWSPRGFIPACAGNTSSCRSRFRVWSVHPRVCGEHLALNDTKTAYVGSSPRVRGTRRTPAIRPCPRRFIPACAGNT